MTLGPLMLDVAGLSLEPYEREILKHPLVGGVILFSRNYHDPEQLAALTNDIRSLRRPHLLIAVDHEGGRVQRFREGFTAIPPMAALGHNFESQAAERLQQAEMTGWLMAAELRSMDVDFSFAPVLDLNYQLSSVIGDRSFHHDPQTVSRLAGAFIKGLNSAYMAAVGKHFPGHGAVKPDSHLDLPHDDRPFEVIFETDMLPFRQLGQNTLAGIMPAHIVYDQCDADPAGFSSFWIDEILRHRLGFRGAVFSDDLSMQGAAVKGNMPQRAAAAIQAGCDMVLVCNQPEAAVEVIDQLQLSADPLRHMRLIRLHGRHPLKRRTLQQSSKWRTTRDMLNRLTDEYQNAANDSA